MALEPRRMRQLRGTPADWTANAAFVPDPGEICVELDGADTKIKVGDGTTAYGALPYIGGVDAVARASIGTVSNSVTTLSTQVAALLALDARLQAVESAIAALQGAGGAAAVYNLQFDFGTAAMLAAEERALVLGSNCTFAADFADALGAVAANPTAPATFEIMRGLVKMADLTIDTAGAIAVVSAFPGVDVPATAGDLITLRLTSAPDATLRGFRYVLPARMTI